MNNFADLLSKYKPNSDFGSKISKELFFIELNKKLQEILKPKEFEMIKLANIKEYEKDNQKIIMLKIYCNNGSIAQIIKLKEKKIFEKIEELKNPFKINKISFEINTSF